jgi:hypothetical protein
VVGGHDEQATIALNDFSALAGFIGLSDGFRVGSARFPQFLKI